MPRLTIQVAVILFALTPNNLFAEEPDIKTCLPWTDRAGMTIGMDRKLFEQLRPTARFGSIDGYPKDPNVTVTGPYVEGDPRQQYQPFWSYYVTNDKLAQVIWAVASRTATDKRITDELSKIRAKLTEAHGPPTMDYGLRLSGGSHAKIRREIFRPSESDIAIVLSATSSVSGSEIGVHIYPLSEVSRLSYETMVKKIDLTRSREDLSGESVVDLLDLSKAKAPHTAQ